MELEDEIYRLQVNLTHELSEIKKLLIPISMYFGFKLGEKKDGDTNNEF